MARRRGGQEFIFTEEVPSTVANAKPTSPTEHLSRVSVAAYQARGASAINNFARGAASKHPPNVVAAPIQTEACALLGEVPGRQRTDCLSRRCESSVGRARPVGTNRPLQIVGERAEIERVGDGQPSQETGRRLPGQRNHTTGKSSHAYLDLSSTRWFSTCALIALTLGSMRLAAGVSTQPPCVATADLPIQSSRP